MYYTYNSLTGRLIGTTQLRANYPQGLEPLRPAEPANPFSSHTLQNKVPVEGQQRGAVTGHQSVRAESSKGVRLGPGGVPYSPVPEKIKMLQKKFQVDDGVLVHLKGGPKDKILLYTTLALGAAALVISARNYYMMLFPKPPSDD